MKTQSILSILKGGAQGIAYSIADKAAPVIVLLLLGVAAAQAAPRDLVHRTAAEYGSVVADFDGDGRDDISVKRDGGTWQIDLAANGFGAWDLTYRGYGGLEAIPVPADYDGDGKADLSIKTGSGGWAIDCSRDGFGAWNLLLSGYGSADARPVPADYDGDGMADLAVKSSGGVWYIDFARNGFGSWDAQFAGYGGDWVEAVPADYDGDRRADLSVKDDSGLWYIDYAVNGFGAWDAQFAGYGNIFARPVPADYDGDGRADLSVKDDSGLWYIDYAANGFGSWDATFTTEAGRPIPGRYDAVAGAELAVRPDCGPWHIRTRVGPVHNQQYSWIRIDSTDAWRNTVTVRTRSKLIEHLRSDFQGVLNIPSGVQIDVTAPFSDDPTDKNLVVNSCTCIKGTRTVLDTGGLLFDKNNTEEHAVFTVHGHDVRIEGLRLRGPSQGNRASSQPYVSGINVTVAPSSGLGRNVVVTGNEFWHWTYGAVVVLGSAEENSVHMTSDQAGFVSVTRNFIHENARDSGGYGVVFSYGYALIEGNLFDRNRHAVAAGGGPHSGYIARYNYVLEGGYTQGGGACDFWNQHFDVHGTGEDGYGGSAGEYFEVSSNTIRGAQGYCLVKTRPAFMLRGKPTIGAYFNDNVVVHNNLDAAVSLKSDKGDSGFGEDHDKFNFFAAGNRFKTDLSLDVAAAGDLDGDGREDLFLANGTGWWYSSAGRTEWRFLRPSTLRLSQLRFGDFNGDGRADVFTQRGRNWEISLGGVSNWQKINESDPALGDFVIGDFDGDRRADVFYADGQKWFISFGGVGMFTHVADAIHRVSNLRFGDFNGDGKTDAFGVLGNNWVVVYGGTNHWATLRLKLTNSVAGLHVADFNGDGRADVATSNLSQVSWGGVGPWVPLRATSNLVAAIGRFHGNAGADALLWRGNFLEIAPGGAGAILRHSSTDLR
jgi:hypothetical protein